MGQKYMNCILATINYICILTVFSPYRSVNLLAGEHLKPEYVKVSYGIIFNDYNLIEICFVK